MSLTRAALITAVAGELDDVLTLAGMTSADDAANMKSPIDQVFRELGTAEASLATATVADGSEKKSVAYATYFVLRRASRALVKKMSVASGGARANLREQYENVRAEMRDALAIAQGYGLAVGLGATPTPYAGGISQSNYDDVALDTDRIPPLFSLTDLQIAGVDNLRLALKDEDGA